MKPPGRRDDPHRKPSRGTLRRAWPVAVLLLALAVAGAWFVGITIPRHIVLASGLQLTQLDELRGKHVAIGSPGSGVRAFVEPLLAANDVTSSNTKSEPAGQSGGASRLAARRD